MRIPNNPAFETENFTVQCWTRAVAPGAYKWILSKARHPTFHSATYGIYSGGSGGLFFFVVLAPPEGNPDGFAFVPASTGPELWDGAWHQVTGTWDGQLVSLYLDGNLMETVDSFGGTLAYTNSFLGGDLLVGEVEANTGAFHFPGDIDEIKYFDHALNADAVLASFNGGAAATNGLVSSWKAEDNTLDSVGTNHGKPLPAPGSLLSDVAVLTIQSGGEVRLNSAAITGGNFQAAVAGISGVSYIVQRTVNFSTWTPVTTNAAPFTFSDPLGGTDTARLYRAISAP